MKPASNNWFSLAILGTGCGLILGYWIVPSPVRRVELDKTEIVFPMIGLFGVGHETVALQNRSHWPVNFQVSAECNCTNVEPTAGVLQANQSQLLHVNYRSKLQANQAMAEERSELRFEFFDSDARETLNLPLVATVHKPFVVDQSQLTMTQVGLRPAEFEIPLSLMDDVQRLEVIAWPGFIQEISASEPIPPFNAVKLTGKTKSRTEISNLTGELQLRLTTQQQQVFTVALPLRLRHEEVYRFQPETLSLRADKSTKLELMQFRPDQYRCEIVGVISAIPNVVCTQIDTTVYEILVEDGFVSSGFLEITTKTTDVKLRQSHTAKHFVPWLAGE